MLQYVYCYRRTLSKAVQQALSLTDCFQYNQGNEISKNAVMRIFLWTTVYKAVIQILYLTNCFRFERRCDDNA
eukprot:7294457-Ditylum_brightwellii.AAC.1